MIRKHSKKRDAVLQTVRSTKEHPSARSIYRALKPIISDLSLGTVYRNLVILKHEEQIKSIGIIDGEERFDGDVMPHSHVICMHCGLIQDIPEIKVLNPEVPDNFVIKCQQSVFYGFCVACIQRNDQKQQ
ncbi:MAG: transcriptional repressor [Treponema sp.]|jgi:Fur family peroxide stress response transcriptional regulator|nr:transcriptional repressor [Treponema sp.]